MTRSLAIWKRSNYPGAWSPLGVRAYLVYTFPLALGLISRTPFLSGMFHWRLMRNGNWVLSVFLWRFHPPLSWRLTVEILAYFFPLTYPHSISPLHVKFGSWWEVGSPVVIFLSLWSASWPLPPRVVDINIINLSFSTLF
jgi:hypothetical protein